MDLKTEVRSVLRPFNGLVFNQDILFLKRKSAVGHAGLFH